jgi:hypothetical protein
VLIDWKWYKSRAPDKLRICVFYAMKMSKNACIIRSECTHYAYILLCKQTFQNRSVRTTCSQIYFRFSSYLLRKPHLFVILTVIGWFILNIQSDLFWHRCLERQAFGTSKKLNIYNILLINMTQSCQIKQRYTFHLHPAFIE